MSEIVTNHRPETLGGRESSDLIRTGMLVVLSTFFTLIVLSPVAYVVHRNLPPHIATVDLQMLVEENQDRVMKVIAGGSEVSDAQRQVAEKLAVDFARRLSDGVRLLAEDCRCVIVNKAALLGGDAVDYTDQLRERLR